MGRIYGLLHAGPELWNFHNPSRSGEDEASGRNLGGDSSSGRMGGGVESGNAGFRLVGCLHTTRSTVPTFSARVRSVTESWRRILIAGGSTPHHLPRASDTEEPTSLITIFGSKSGEGRFP